MELVKTAKVSSKGQVTLPRKAREALGSRLVRIVVEEGAVRIEPITDLAGSLKRYAKKRIPISAAREQAWDAVVREKHERR
ncbi:MAG: AbrB/MazE/SpoVT family DNA-binding domain-containing protein [Betaproteobacteria bacterium]|nr:AbrB/MazE/SpoVT family DNA-binding domain-containing protein [Betaproteobacteria bacterium]